MLSNRARIDAQYLLGDTLIKSGEALAIFAALAVAAGPALLKSQPESVAPFSGLICAAFIGAGMVGFAGLRLRRGAVRLER